MEEFGSGLRAHLGFVLDDAPMPATAPVEAEPEVEVSPHEAELAQRLEYLAAAEAAVVAREQAIAAWEQEVAARAEAIAAEERRLPEAASVRELLRRKLEAYADLVWSAFEEALRSEDLALRLTAAQLLLAEAYREGEPAPGAVSVEDELARLRQRRFAG